MLGSNLNMTTSITRHLRNKVFLVFGGFTFVLSLTYSAISIMVAYAVEDAVLDAIVEEEAEFIESTYRESGQIAMPRVDYMRVYSDLEQAPAPVRETLQAQPNRKEVFTNDEKHFHVRYLDIGEHGKQLLVAEVTTLLIVSNLSIEILFLLFLVLLLGMILSVWLAYRIARYTTQPVQSLAAQVVQQEDAEGPVVLPGTQSGDELAYLASTIEHSMNHLKHALKRESDFTRDVSHELRTPLTVIKNMCALAEQRDLNDRDRQQLTQATGQIERTLETLLALARAKSLQVETLGLRALIEESCLEIDQKLGLDEFRLDITIADDFKIRANPHLLTLLFNNLIENAARHASKPSLDIHLEERELVFKNPSSGSISDRVFEPNEKRPDSTGLGHGLYLVNRIADTLGWQCQASIEEGYYQLRLQLPVPAE